MLSTLPTDDGFLRSEAMEPPQWNARRATLDDLAALQALWQGLGMPWEQLEHYLTEFQIVVGEDGVLHAAMGLLVEGTEALMHTEALAPGTDDANADELRAALWRRMQIVARNQGVARIWTQEDAPYWLGSGFVPPGPSVLGEAKATFINSDPGWRIYPLIDPERASRIVQEQMAIWATTRDQEANAFMDTIRGLRNGAFILTAVIIAVLLGLTFYVVSKRPDFLQQLLRR